MVTVKKGSKGEAVKTLQRALGITEDGVFGAQTEAAVMRWQAAHGLTADGIVGMMTWQRLGVTSARRITEIIVHCTATGQGQDVTVKQVNQWHWARGFNGIGYHYLIYIDGSVHTGRSIDVSGAHCTGHNMCSIGVCYVGGLASDGKTPKDTRTAEQKAALLELIKRLKRIYPKAKVYGHRDWANKACPCFDATKEYQDV